MNFKSKLRKWNNIIHRDIGYFFFGVTIIYGLSGIALNHKVIDKWNAEYIVFHKSFDTDFDLSEALISDEKIINFLNEIADIDEFKKYYFPESEKLKIFIEGGTVIVDTKTGKGEIETLNKRPIFNEFSYLHYNPSRWWMYFSDVFAAALMLLAITGLFVVRGKKGIKWRGLIIASAGIIIPILFLFVFR